MSWPGSERPASTSAIMRRMASARRPRSTGTQPIRSAYHPRIGMRLSSDFITNLGRGTSETIMMMSRNDWCLAAISTSPVGTGPRTSVSIPTIHRALQRA